MTTINKIMVAVDLSDDSIAAAKYAAKLAVDLDATLLLTNVINQRDVDMMNIVATRVPEFSVKQYVNEKRDDRKEGLVDVAKKIHTGTMDIETNVRIGIPYEALMKEIEEKKPDLLVMGKKGRSNLVDIVVGSCAQKMFRRCPIPLLSTRAGQS